MGELGFSWDRKKARSNARKHGVPFEEAQTVFMDDDALLLLDDPEHSLDEKRYLLLGLSAFMRILLVSHSMPNADTIRLINAREATHDERRQYRERLGK